LNSNCIININNVCRNQGDNLQLLDLAFSKINGLYNNNDTDLNNIYNQLRQQCIAESNLTQAITIQDINIGICNPKFITEFNFVNSGEAVSNCLTSSILNLSKESLLVENYYTSFLNDNFTSIIIGGCISFVLVIMIIFLHKDNRVIFWRKT
jgi:hypothetical protein